MITHQVLLRGAAQCFLLNSALQLTDVVILAIYSYSYRQIGSVLHSTGADIILTFKTVIGLIYVLNALLQSSVTLDDVFKILMDFRANESLCRGSKMWKQVSCSRNPFH